MQLPEPPTVAGGVSDADILAYGAACWRAGWRHALRQCGAWAREWGRRVTEKETEAPPLSVRYPSPENGTPGKLIPVDAVRGSQADPSTAVPS